jgi:hypothetical protein
MIRLLDWLNTDIDVNTKSNYCIKAIAIFIKTTMQKMLLQHLSKKL